MSSHLNPYIGFAGSARDAMEFYKDVFGGELNMNTYGDFGQAGTPNESLIMHAQLETPAGFTLMAADSTEGTDTPDSDISISLSGDDEADLRGYWAKLSDGGSVSLELAPQMWGDTFGMCTDRYGVKWMVNITGASA